MMTPSTEIRAGLVLDEEQRLWVKDCLAKDGLSLGSKRLKKFIDDIEKSIATYEESSDEGRFRHAHDALRELWQLCHEDDAPIGQIRERVAKLPRNAVRYLNRRAPMVSSRLFPDTPAVTSIQEWTKKAHQEQLIRLLSVISAEGARIVEGRSRGSGKRSGRRIEPEIMGKLRGVEDMTDRGGRPVNDAQRNLVTYLALDWAAATDQLPKGGRSDHRGFGALVYFVFDWLGLKHDAACYALRARWDSLSSETARSEGGKS